MTADLVLICRDLLRKYHGAEFTGFVGPITDVCYVHSMPCAEFALSCLRRATHKRHRALLHARAGDNVACPAMQLPECSIVWFCTELHGPCYAPTAPAVHRKHDCALHCYVHSSM